MKVTGGLRYRMCPDCGELHDKYGWPDNHRLPHEAICAPNVVRDDQTPIQSMVDGKVYDSKRALRATYQPSGNREGVQYTEVGGDKSILKPYKKPKPDRMKIKAAVHSAFSKVGLGA